MELQTIINNVLPEGSILYKHNHGLFDFYMDDRDFIDGIDFLSQNNNENFEEFINRLIKVLIEKEKNDPEPLVSIDYSIKEGNN